MHSIDKLQSHYQLREACANVRTAAVLPARHWLLDAVYGRELLKLKLRKLDPGITVPIWTDPPELAPLLEQMVDEMDLRGWPKPVGIKGPLALSPDRVPR